MCKSFESPSSKDNPVNDQAPFLYFSKWNTRQTKTHTHTRTHTHTHTHTHTQEKNNSSKQYFMSSISVTFISNTGWDLIQSNNNLRHHKKFMKNKYNCIGLPEFKSQRHRVRQQPNQNLLHHYQRAKNQLISSIQY